MKAVLDFGNLDENHFYRWRFRNVSDDKVFVIFAIMVGSAAYSFKHKCWIVYL